MALTVKEKIKIEYLYLDLTTCKRCIKTANNFEVTKPVPIFISTLKLFKEVILNRSVCVMFLINFNLVFI